MVILDTADAMEKDAFTTGVLFYGKKNGGFVEKELILLCKPIAINWLLTEKDSKA